MNQEARDKLVEAELAGVKQIKGNFSHSGGRCALGVLGFGLGNNNAKELMIKYGFIEHKLCKCPLLNTDLDTYSCSTRMTETQLVVHMNDDHSMSFLDIARKFPEPTNG